MTGVQLIEAVALRMDEITPDSALTNIAVDGSDNNPLYTLIESVINDAALELFSTAPYWRLPTTAFSTKEVAAIPGDDTRKMIRIQVPDGYLRVAEISCAYFHRPIAEVFPKYSTEGKRQYNKHLRAGVAKPVGVMSSGLWGSDPAVSHRQIECYSLPSTATDGNSNVAASYIAKPATIVYSDASISGIPTDLFPALEWFAAAKAFGARGDTNHMAICQQNAQNLLV